MKNKNFNSLSDLLYGLEPTPSAGPLSKLLNFAEPPSAPVFPAINSSLYSSLLGVSSSPAPLSALGSLASLIGAPSLPAPAPIRTGIRFNNNDFSEPTAFGGAWLPTWPGLYAILVSDSRCSPRPYRVIYFGKAVDLSSRATRSHEKFDEWNRVAGAGVLYITFLSMPISSERERAAIEEDLIKHYAPECNRTFNPLAGLCGY
jgi:hypothetical protein